MKIQKQPDQSLGLINRAQFAALAKTPTRTLTRWADRGLVPPPVIRLGNVVRWRESDVVAFLKGGQP